MAAVTGRLEVEVEIKSDAKKYWQNIRESHTLFPKICADLYKSIEVLEGDGRSAGSIRLVTYADGKHMHVIYLMFYMHKHFADHDGFYGKLPEPNIRRTFVKISF